MIVTNEIIEANYSVEKRQGSRSLNGIVKMSEMNGTRKTNAMMKTNRYISTNGTNNWF